MNAGDDGGLLGTFLFAIIRLVMNDNAGKSRTGVGMARPAGGQQLLVIGLEAMGGVRPVAVGTERRAFVIELSRGLSVIIGQIGFKLLLVAFPAALNHDLSQIGAGKMGPVVMARVAIPAIRCMTRLSCSLVDGDALGFFFYQGLRVNTLADPGMGDAMTIFTRVVVVNSAGIEVDFFQISVVWMGLPPFLHGAVTLSTCYAGVGSLGKPVHVDKPAVSGCCWILFCPDITGEKK